ncbi:conserved hypothetical protein [Catenulispora acidiphila DSM 44928]|uniref:Uncharacterized protein n=1 Tax=Catenulispora acidiphila (strain DSM 44928 / JCM 14897 / NBRC 102108 / NRRL B-24433 / ID139908) TaxID=479433 RepID=C7QKC6_CATAD|nr:hypothetical protein [Catenulispora acidiphila]ACU75200.1 conserved hypothetical protein [Catenulispora acidiphila DSM 44928]
MSAAGTWNLTIDSPLGKQRASVTLTQSADNTWTGNSLDLVSGEASACYNIEVNGEEVGWQQQITKPMKLKLTYKLKLDGDTLAGKVKAGLFPASKVVGERVSEDAVKS